MIKMIVLDVFLMFLRSLNHPGMIADRFWIIHFFIIFYHFLSFFWLSAHKNSSVYPNKHGFEAADLKFNMFSIKKIDINES